MKWIYKSALIAKIDDREENVFDGRNIAKLMNTYGEEGWEIFSVEYKYQDGIPVSVQMFMKKQLSLGSRLVECG